MGLHATRCCVLGPATITAIRVQKANQRASSALMVMVPMRRALARRALMAKAGQTVWGQSAQLINWPLLTTVDSVEMMERAFSVLQALCSIIRSAFLSMDARAPTAEAAPSQREQRLASVAKRDIMLLGAGVHVVSGTASTVRAQASVLRARTVIR